jgi:hypothetical protein
MTEADRIVAWAERQTGETSMPARRPEGRAGHLSSEEKAAIRVAYLESGGTITRKALAVQFGVNRDTVSACLQGKDFEALQQQFEAELRATAISRLKAHAVPAAAAWCEAVEIAKEKGDHRPAKELLLHAKVIEPVGGGPMLPIQVTINGIVLAGMGLDAEPADD